MDEKYANKRLVRFKKMTILAGPTLPLRGFYNLLKELGADIESKNLNDFLHTKNHYVLLLINEGTNKLFPKVRVLKKSWWDYYYNPKYNRKSTIVKTYNIPKQWKDVCEKVLILEDKPILIPE